MVSTFGSYWLGDSPSKAFDMQWTMDCANDIITLDPPGLVPEPASAALVLPGAGLMAGLRRSGAAAQGIETHLELMRGRALRSPSHHFQRGTESSLSCPRSAA